MKKYKVTARGLATFRVEAENETAAIHQAETMFEDVDVCVFDVYSWQIEEIIEPTAVIPVVEMAALVPSIAEDFKTVRLFLSSPSNYQLPLDEITRVLNYAECSMPIKLADDAREGMEMDMPNYIHYWGTFTDDDTTIETCDGQTVKLPENWIDKGLIVLAGIKYSRLGELLSGDYDAESLDCLVQAAVFGEIVYG